MKFNCYLLDTEDNPFADYARTPSMQQDRFRMSLFDPFVVEIEKSDDNRVQVVIYYQGRPIAHSLATSYGG